MELKEQFERLDALRKEISYIKYDLNDYIMDWFEEFGAKPIDTRHEYYYSGFGVQGDSVVIDYIVFDNWDNTENTKQQHVAVTHIIDYINQQK